MTTTPDKSAKMLDEIFLDVSIAANATEIFYDIFSSSQHGDTVDDATKLCDMLYVLTLYIRQGGVAKCTDHAKHRKGLTEPF